MDLGHPDSLYKHTNAKNRVICQCTYEFLKLKYKMHLINKKKEKMGRGENSTGKNMNEELFVYKTVIV